MDIFDKINPAKQDIFDKINPSTTQGDLFDKLNPSQPETDIAGGIKDALMGGITNLVKSKLLPEQDSEEPKTNQTSGQLFTDFLKKETEKSPTQTVKEATFPSIKGVQQIANVSSAGRQSLLNLLGKGGELEVGATPAAETTAAFLGKKEVGDLDYSRKLWDLPFSRADKSVWQSLKDLKKTGDVGEFVKTISEKATVLGTGLVLDPVNLATTVLTGVSGAITKAQGAADIAFLKEAAKRLPQIRLSASEVGQLAKTGEFNLATLYKTALANKVDPIKGAAITEAAKDLDGAIGRFISTEKKGFPESLPEGFLTGKYDKLQKLKSPEQLVPRETLDSAPTLLGANPEQEIERRLKLATDNFVEQDTKGKTFSLGKGLVKKGDEFGKRAVARDILYNNDTRWLSGKLKANHQKLTEGLTPDQYRDWVYGLSGELDMNKVPVSYLNSGFLDKIKAGRADLDELGRLAEKVGYKMHDIDGEVTTFKMLENYFPRRLTSDTKLDLINKMDIAIPEEQQSILKNLGLSQDKIDDVVKFWKSRMKLQTRPLGEKRVLDIGMKEAKEKLGIDFRVDREVLDEYYDAMSHKLLKQLYYGENYGTARLELDTIGAKYGAKSKQFKDAQTLLERSMGIVLEKDPISGKLNPVLKQKRRFLEETRAAMAFKLGLSTRMMQTAQRIQVGSQSVKGFLKSFTDDGIMLAKEFGVSDLTALKNTNGMARWAKESDSMLSRAANTYINKMGIIREDQKARVAAANVADVLTNNMFKLIQKNPNNRTAKDFFKSYGLAIDLPSAIKRGSLTQYERGNIARMYDREFNFWLLTSDVPKYLSGELGKTMHKFWPSAYAQTMLVKRILLRTAKTGNVWPLVNYTIAANFGGEAYGDINDIMKGRNPFEARAGRPGMETPLARFYDNVLTQGTGLGVLENFYDTAKFAGGPVQTVANIVFGNFGSIGKSIYDFGKAADKGILKGDEDSLRKIGRKSFNLPLVPADIAKVGRTLTETEEDRAYREEKESQNLWGL